MLRKPPVKDRLKSLASPPRKPDGTLAMADFLLDESIKSGNGKRIACTVDQHCRTRIFDFPRCQPTEPVPHCAIYRSKSVQANLVCDLQAYFEQSENPHYRLSPALRHKVAELIQKTDSLGERTNPYIVVEESHRFPALVLDRVCAMIDEICHEDGKPVQILVGGRANAQFIVAYETSDGPWPEIPDDERTVNMILAATRACQDAHYEIRKHVDQGCLVTCDGQYVCPRSAGFMSARADSAQPLDADGFRETGDSLRAAVSRMESDLTRDHVELLLNAVYWDDYKDDDFRRLHYLSLWQSLAESKRKLGYTPPSPGTKLANDPTVVGGTLSLKELTSYRDDIAHCWTSSIDGGYLANMYRTINELLRRKYFQ